MPSTTAAEEKAALRKAVKGIRLSPAEKAESDRLLRERFLALPQVAHVSSLLLFYGVGAEPDTVPLLEALSDMGKLVALPRCLPGGRLEARRYLGSSHLVPGPFGIPEPDGDCPVLDRDSFDLILVPDLCCDRRGSRLGRGGGYYDRFLRGFSGLTAALCREKLLRDALPAEEHDVPVDLVLTERQSLSSFRGKKSGA